MSSQDVLPISPTPSATIAGRTMQESTYQRWVQARRLPEDAPNVPIVLIDDAGPGLPTTFGGEVRTDTLTRIHNQGIGYNRFQTTAMCSPPPASLLTGRNHHRIGNGQIAEFVNDGDGYAGETRRAARSRRRSSRTTGTRPRRSATAPRLAVGYSTHATRLASSR